MKGFAVIVAVTAAVSLLLPAAATSGGWQPSSNDLRVSLAVSQIGDETSVIDLFGVIDRRLLEQDRLVIVRSLFHVEQECSSLADTITAHADLGLGAYELDVSEPDVTAPGMQLDWSAEIRFAPNLLPGYTDICPPGYGPTTGLVEVDGARVVVYPGPSAPPLDRAGDPIEVLLELPSGVSFSKGHLGAHVARAVGVVRT